MKPPTWGQTAAIAGAVVYGPRLLAKARHAFDEWALQWRLQAVEQVVDGVNTHISYTLRQMQKTQPPISVREEMGGRVCVPAEGYHTGNCDHSSV